MIKPHFIAGGPPETPISYAKLGVKSREIEDPSQPHRVSAPHPPWGCMAAPTLSLRATGPKLFHPGWGATFMVR